MQCTLAGNKRSELFCEPQLKFILKLVMSYSANTSLTEGYAFSGSAHCRNCIHSYNVDQG